MLPTNGGILNEYIEMDVERQPSKTFKLDWDTYRMRGHVDGRDSVKQAIYRIIHTERYQYIHVSWNYGIELLDLFGEPTDFVLAVLPQRFMDAVMTDDRVTGVETLDLSERGRTITARFAISTIYGDFEIEREVAV